MSIGKRNRYTCQGCLAQLISIDVDDGVTPFMIKCEREGCAEFMTSEMYMCPQDLEVSHEWYAPDRKQRKKLHPGEREHVNKGGLLMRPITQRGKHRLYTGPLE